MNRTLVLATTAALLMSGQAPAAFAQSASAAETADAADLAKSCEALSAEAANLNGKMNTDQAAAKPSVAGAVGRTVAGNVAGNVTQRAGLTAISKFGGHMGTFGALAAIGASHAAGQTVASKVTNAGTAQATPIANAADTDRMHLLMVAYKQKGC